MGPGSKLSQDLSMSREHRSPGSILNDSVRDDNRAQGNKESHVNSATKDSKSRISEQSKGQQPGKPIDFSKLSKRTSFKPTSVQEIVLPSVLYKLVTF